MIYALVYYNDDYVDCHHSYIAEFPDGTTVEQMRHALGHFVEFEVLDVVPYAVAKPEKPKRRGKRFSRMEVEGWSDKLQTETDRDEFNERQV